MNRFQQVAIVGALVVSGWQVITVTTPSGHRCSAAAVEAFSRVPPDQSFGLSAFLRREHVRLCRPPARDRLWRSGVIVVLATVGASAAVRVFHDGVGCE